MPSQLEPKFVERVWGRLDLAPLYPLQAKPIGEVWFDNGPLLIKFLFTSEKLSVQVHPEDPYAAQHHDGSAGKTEMWYILAAEPGSKIALGFDRDYPAPKVRAAAESGAIMDMLQWIEAKPGETYFVPAGTVHALGGGFVVCEIQQTSDITYRMYDYNRGRELHLDHSMNVARLGPYANPEIDGERLAACPYFVTHRMEFAPGMRNYHPTGHPAEALMILSGSGRIAGAPFTAGTVWNATGASFAIQCDTPIEALRTYVP